MKNKSVWILIITIIISAVAISSGSYAYWVWTSDVNKSVVFSTADIERYVIYDEGDSHFVGDFQPSSNYCGGMSNTISFSLDTENMTDAELQKLNDDHIYGTIKMDINAFEGAASVDYMITDEYINSHIQWVVTYGEASSCTGNEDDIVMYGTFASNKISEGATIDLLADEILTTDTKVFTIWIWLDSRGGAVLNELENNTIDVNIWTQFELNESDSECVIYYNSYFGSWSQIITRGEEFSIPITTPLGYEYDAYYFQNDPKAHQWYPGDIVRLPCGATLYACHSEADRCLDLEWD